MSIWRGKLLQAYNSTGRVQGVKIWYGTATTNASGVWSVDYSSAGFTSPPVITANCTSAGTTAASVVNTKTSTKTNTGATGVAVIPAVSVLGLITVALAGAGVQVDVMAIGQ